MTRIVGRNPKRYMPIDEWLEAPRTRILRALRWFDWVDSDELFLAIGVDRGDTRARDAYCQMLVQLVRQGAVRKRGERGAFQYRLASGISVDPPPCWKGAS